MKACGDALFAGPNVVMNRPPLPQRNRGARHSKGQGDGHRPFSHAPSLFAIRRTIPAGVPSGRLEGGAGMRTILARLMVAFLLCNAVAVPRPAQARPILATAEVIAVYASVLQRINPEMPNWQSRDLARRVLVNASRWQLDANMLIAIVTVESRWHTQAISRKGAIGLGQLMPGTAEMLGVDPHNPAQNLSGAARYLRGLMERFGSNRYDLVLAAYNAGPEAVEMYGGIPPYDETQNYVVKVMSAWRNLDEMVHVPAETFVEETPVHGPDVDYWLEGVQR
jgi:soluble lytic murein transglycosylase-like protein